MVPVISVTDLSAVNYAILSSVHKLIHLRALLAMLLIAALAAPAFACLGDASGAQKPCETMECCHHSSAAAPAQSMKKCDCSKDDTTRQSGLAGTHNVQLVVLATVAMVAPAGVQMDRDYSEFSSASPPASQASSILRL